MTKPPSAAEWDSCKIRVYVIDPECFLLVMKWTFKLWEEEFTINFFKNVHTFYRRYLIDIWHKVYLHAIQSDQRFFPHYQI